MSKVHQYSPKRRKKYIIMSKKRDREMMRNKDRYEKFHIKRDEKRKAEYRGTLLRFSW